VAWRRARRGRPKLANAKRRATTVRGRMPDPDTGSAALRARKRHVTGREDLELTAVSVLFGHGLIDRPQHDSLAEITLWLETMARAWGGLERRNGACGTPSPAPRCPRVLCGGKTRAVPVSPTRRADACSGCVAASMAAEIS
jgi:hypothetical protein